MFRNRLLAVFLSVVILLTVGNASTIKEDVLTISSKSISSQDGGHFRYSNMITSDLLYLSSNVTNSTHNGITYTFNDNKCTVKGTSTAASYKNIYADKTCLPDGMTAGQSFNVKYRTSDKNVRLALFFKDSSGNNIKPSQYLTTDRTVNIPQNAIGLIARIDVIANTTVDTTVEFTTFSFSSSQETPAQITTEKQNYLVSTGDTTDVTDSIVTMLKQNGVCHLGPGLFCVSGIDMPDDAMLTGCGSKTVIRLNGSGSYAVKMNHRNTVSDLTIEGSNSNITLNENVGTRHGILWQGNYSNNRVTVNQPTYGILNNLRIRRFTGGGITCSDTGYGTINFIEGTNIIVNNCNAGINISYWSEYHKFTNVRTYGCYYGCINNGGNNTFVNCDFSTCNLGFLMDNANSQSPNNSHGSAVGCVFNHTDSNKGVGIKIVNCNNGYIFTGCQIHFSKTVIRDSSGIVFSSCNCRNDDITITNGGAILFVNNMYASQPKKTITNNNTVRFVNCYVRSDGTAVE